MLRITRETDYAILLLSAMVPDPERTVSTAWLAQKAQLSRPMVSKVLKHLVRGELVSSQRGAQGGYQLNRSADDISVADIIRAIEGPIALAECVNIPNKQPCPRLPHCHVAGHWQLISRAIEDTLGNISLSAMNQPVHAHFPQRQQG